MIGDRKKSASYQSNFYRNYYHKILNGIIFCCLTILLLTGVIIYFVLVHPPYDYYATTLGGQIIHMTPLRQ